MKRKRIPKKGTNDVLSSEFEAKEIQSTPDEIAGKQTNEKTLNTWEMKQNSSVLNEDLNTEKTLNTWEMTQSPEEELTDTEESQIAESDESYTESDNDNSSYQFI